MKIVAANIVASWLPNSNWLQCWRHESFYQYHLYKNRNGDNEKLNYCQAMLGLDDVNLNCYPPQGKYWWDNFMQAVQKQVVM